jgi:hypothetical protein
MKSYLEMRIQFIPLTILFHFNNKELVTLYNSLYFCKSRYICNKRTNIIALLKIAWYVYEKYVNIQLDHTYSLLFRVTLASPVRYSLIYCC